MQAILCVQSVDGKSIVPLLGDDSGVMLGLGNPAGITAEPSADHQVTGNTADIVNAFGKGAAIFINISAISGAAAQAIVKVQAKDPASGNYFDIPGAVTAALNATGQTLLQIYPGIAAVANAAVNQSLPRVWRVLWTISGTSPHVTFSVGANYLL